ncbi:MAG: hypothetical protein HY753_04800 [Nitrospirae bacterium]|nr:hypothetical protein [Nitrospirota bacterium]
MKKKNDNTILVFAQEAGTALVLSPIIDYLRINGNYRIEIHALPPAIYSLSDKYDVIEWNGFPKRDVSLLLTGFGHPRMDINREIFGSAFERGIGSIAVLDNWKALERFLEKNGSVAEKLPDIIAVMDKKTCEVLMKMGVPSERLVVTGHPGIEMLSAKKITEDDRASARMQLDIPLKSRVCLIASEILHFHGFYESCNNKCCSLLNAISERAKLFEEIKRLERKETLFLLRTHPNERFAQTEEIRKLEWRQADELTILSTADNVFGLTTILVQLSVSLGIPTYNVQPLLRNWMPENSFLRFELWEYLSGRGYLGELHGIKAGKPNYRGATMRIVDLIETHLSH